MKKYILGVIFSIGFLVSPAFAHQVQATGLDSCEINAIIQLVQTFNADPNVLINVQTSLGTPTIGVDQSGNVCQPMILSVTVTGNAPATVTESPTASITCGADVVDKPNVDAAPALLKCFSERSNSVTTINLKPGNYYIKTSIDISSLSNITLQTEGVTSGIACLKPGSTNKCAVLTAMDTNTSANIVTSVGASNFSLKYVGIDGNGEVRQNISPLPRLTGTNATIRYCTNCHFSGIGIIRAVRYGGLVLVFSDNSVVDNSYFANNGVGYLTDSGGKWSDGITVAYSRNFVLENSDFSDNSDVDLIVGGVVGEGPNNTIIRNNHITHSNNYAFAGLMLHVFDTEKVGYDANFSGTVVSGNTIDCGNGMCGIGLDLGPNLWNSIWVKTPSIKGGTVTDNSISGARQGILIAGADGTNVNNNTVSVSGTYSGLVANKTCTTGVISNSEGDTAIVRSNSVGVSPSALVLNDCGPVSPATLPLISGVPPVQTIRAACTTTSKSATCSSIAGNATYGVASNATQGTATYYENSCTHAITGLAGCSVPTVVAPAVTYCTSWSYGSFGSCQSNNLKIRPVIASYPAGCTGGNPVFTQNCTYIPPVQTVTAAPDYTAFLTTTYQTELGRAPDSAGLTYWLDKLTTGAVTQDQVTNFIHNSAEAVTYRSGSASALNAFNSATNAGPSESPSAGNTSTFHYVWNNNLQIGSSNTEDVKALQTALTREGVYTGEISGGFYNQTFSAVKAFQQKYGIDTGTNGAGFVGLKTRMKLNSLY